MNVAIAPITGNARLEAENARLRAEIAGLRMELSLWVSKTPRIEGWSVEAILNALRAIPKSLRMPGGDIRLATVRAELPGVPGNFLDSALIELQDRRVLVLWAYESQAMVLPEDAAAAVTVGGRPCHAMVFKDAGW
ncbi:MAG: hypothetical protein LBG06_11605 [Deltaproteobacteria bacterium]|nr:hypothetical protein [Deltaproteobacteria bacterium]